MRRFKSFFLEARATKTELSVKNYVKSILDPLGIKVEAGSSGGSPWNIRAAVGPDPIAFFKSHKIKCKDSAESASGTYDTYELDIPDVGKALFVNQVRASAGGEASLTTKQLTPDAFNLGGQTVTTSEIKKIVNTTIKTMPKLGKQTKQFLIDLLSKADEKGNSIDISDIIPKDVSKRDLATISKDYGEILSAIWSISNIGFNQVYFPSLSNEPLADFFGLRMRFKYPVSVKSGGGSSTTVKNLTDVLEAHMQDPTYLDNFSDTERALLDVLFLLKDSSVMDGIIESNKRLNTDGAKALAKVIGVNVNALSLNVIENHLATYKNNQQIKTALAPFHKKMDRYVDDRTWSRLKGKALIGFVVGPMGHYLTEVLTTKYAKELTVMVKQITLVQLNIDVKTKALVAKYGKFKNMKFKFSWGGGAPNPKRNKIGFKVSK